MSTPSSTTDQASFSSEDSSSPTSTTDQTGLGMSYMQLALVIGITTIVVLFAIVTCNWIKQHGAPKPDLRKIGIKKKRRKKKDRKRARTKTQLKTLMIVTRQLHSFYNDQEAQGKIIAEHQRKSHQRLQERLAERKSVQNAVKDHKAVVAALQAQKEGLTVDVGEALARDVDWRTEDSGINYVSGDFDLEELSLEHDAIIDEIHEGGVFRDALDHKKPVKFRRQSSLKLLNALKLEDTTTSNKNNADATPSTPATCKSDIDDY